MTEQVVMSEERTIARPTRRADLAMWSAITVGVGLRSWQVWSQQLSFDEAYTADAASRSPSELLTHLRHWDTHPPLDYLLRAPLAGAGSELLLRLPSVLLSVATLLALRAWMRSRGRIGAWTVVVASVSTMWVFHGREARMYALVILAGVIAAWAAERWLERPTDAAAGIAAAASLAAMLSQSIAIVFVASLALLPGLRRDRDAWRWRGALFASGVTWLVLWGPSFVTQLGRGTPGWIAHTTPAEIFGKLAQLVNYRSETAIVIVPLLVVGAVLLWHADRPIARVAAVTFAVPFAVISAVGVWTPVLIARSLAFGSWVPVVLVATTAAWLHDRFATRGAAGAALLLVALVVAPSLQRISGPAEPRPVIAEAIASSAPGDEMVIDPWWLQPLLDWELTTKRRWSARTSAEPEEAGRTYTRPGSSRTGHQWLVSHVDAALPPDPAAPRCAPDRLVRDFRLVCLVVGR